MPAIILDGAGEAGRILEEVASAVRRMAVKGLQPKLAAIRANDDAGTAWYAKAQAKHCAEHGVLHELIDLGPNATEAEVVAAAARAGSDPGVSGIIVFTPLPPDVSLLKVVEAIPPSKDAEGVHPANMGRLLLTGRSEPSPCTAMAAIALIKSACPDLSGKRALVIGRSATVGKPAALLLLAEHATVTIAHTRSDIRAAMLEAEVVIAAAGASGAKWRSFERRRDSWRTEGGDKPAPPDLAPLVSVDMVRRGAIVVDVGDNQIPTGIDGDGYPVRDVKGKPSMRYAGDVDFEKVKEVAGHITNPRGSVGPLTNAFLLRNVVRAGLAASSSVS